MSSVERTAHTLVNGSFRMQRVTGQQRYATEIANRLVAKSAFEEIAPTGSWRSSSLRVWMWVLLRLSVLSRGAILVSLTARAALSHRRQVLVVHDLFVLTNPEWFSRKFVVTHAPLLRIQLKRAIAVVAVSEPVAREVSDRYRGLIVVAPNAPSVVFGQRDDAADAAALERRGLSPHTYLLTVGSIDPRKNLPALAAAYARLSDAERAATPLVVVGGGAAVFRDETIDWPQGTVDAGYVDDEELRALYRNSLAVVFPSKAEGFGLPLVEAAAAGAPRLVISEIPVFRWICGEGATYVDPGSIDSIADGIREAIAGDGPSLRMDLTRFDWDTSADAIDALCTKIALGAS